MALSPLNHLVLINLSLVNGLDLSVVMVVPDSVPAGPALLPPQAPLRLREIVSEYSLALLLTGTQQCTNFYLNNNKTRGEQVRYWKGTVSIERQLLLQGYDKAFSLVAGSCSLCKECAYPEACRFPAEKRPTIESFAIDMIGTLKNLGIKTKVARDPKEPFKYYTMILLV
ncbi:MAG: hypothetical protein BA873_07855 [Desulfobulbaceae bacterium C00003063]|nr:MAG: hypothetical protein BA873_07855 [Desulfobulbaceae bacterium C00003063]